jgi:hypothetical protein
MSDLNVFVIMPFKEEFDHIYDRIKETLKGTFNNQIKINRADDLENKQSIIKDIVVGINESDLIIADLTGLNANVFYELGIAHGLGKKVILLTQVGEKLPFDLQPYRVFFYSTTFHKIKELDENICNTVQGLIDKEISFGSPVSDFLSFPKNIQIDNSKIIESQHNSIEKPTQKGSIDFLADMKTSLNNLTESTELYNISTIDVSKKINDNTQKIREAIQRTGKGNYTYSYIRKLTREIAYDLEKYSKDLEENNKQYEESWNIFENSISNFLIDKHFKINDKNRENLKNFIKIMELSKTTFNTASMSIEKSIKAFSNIKGFESNLTNAAEFAEISISKFNNLVEKAYFSLDRIIFLAEQKLNDEVKPEKKSN